MFEFFSYDDANSTADERDEFLGCELECHAVNYFCDGSSSVSSCYMMIF